MKEILTQLEERDLKINNNLFNIDSIILSKKILDITNEIKNLINKKELLTSKFSKIENGNISIDSEYDITKLNAELVDLYREKETISNQLQHQQNEITKYQEIKNKTLKEIEKIKVSQKELEELNINLSLERTNFELKLDNIQLELSTLNKKYEDINSQTNVLKKSIEEYSSKILESTKFIKETEKSCPNTTLNRFHSKIDLHTSQINGILFGPKYESVITIGEDKKLIQLGLPNLNEILNVPTRVSVLGFSLHEESGHVSLSCSDKALRVLDLSTGRIKTELINHTDCATDSIWISRNQILSASKDRTIKIFDLTRNAVSSTIMATSAVFSLCQTDQPAVYAGACSDGSIRIFDTRTKKVANKIEKIHSKQLTSVVSSPNGEIIYSLGLDGCICETSMKTGSRLKIRKEDSLEIKNPLSKLSINQLGSFLCVPSFNSKAYLFDLLKDSPPIILQHEKGEVLCSTFASNLLITVDTTHNLYFWIYIFNLLLLLFFFFLKKFN